MNDNMNIDDGPWENNIIDLRGLELTVEQKLWLGQYSKKIPKR